MHTKLVAGAALVTLAMIAAGCTGSFNLHQTEPLRVQLDGESRAVKVAQSDAQPQKVLVENTAKATDVEVKVEVKKVSESPVTVLVTVQDSATNETLATKQITVGGTNTTQTNTTTTTSQTTNTTTNPTGTTTGQVVNQNIFVNVKGKGNLVVITQAQQGTAEVNIAAHQVGSSTTQQGNGTYGP
jgi:DNA polymerase III alpha subunit